MKVKVKICGIRSIEHAERAIAAGADFLGFNFVASSKRYIDPLVAKNIIDFIKGTIKTVGVFQEASVEQVNKIAEDLDLDFVQLHGKEDLRYRKKIKRKIIKRFIISTDEKRRVEGSLAIAKPNDNVLYHLIDRVTQGQGEMVDLEKAKEIAIKNNIFFSGGLTPENVGDVIRKVRPFAVDVAGGIETSGVLDNEKMKAFITNAKGISL